MMSVSDQEFLNTGVGELIRELRSLRERVGRLERYSEPSLSPPGGERAERQGVPPLRHFNARWHNGFTADTVARPRSVLALDEQGNADYRAAGGLMRVNEIVAGAGDTSATLSSRDATWRVWSGASAAASAPFRVDQSGNLVSTAGSVGGFDVTTGCLTASDIGLSTGTYAFWAGDTDPASAEFRVTNAGAVTATNIVATGGSVGGFTITENSILSGSFGMDESNRRYKFNRASTYINEAGGTINIVVDGFVPFFIDEDTVQISDSHDLYVTNGSAAVVADKKVSFDGTAGCAYFIFDSAASKIRLYISGAQSASWA